MLRQLRVWGRDDAVVNCRQATMAQTQKQLELCLPVFSRVLKVYWHFLSFFFALFGPVQNYSAWLISTLLLMGKHQSFLSC